MRRRATAALALLLATPVARAEPNPLAVDLRWDVPVILGAGAFAAGLSTSAAAPSRCRWCSSNGFDTAIRGHLAWHDTRTAGTLSYVLAYGILPGAALVHSGVAGWAYRDARLAVEDTIVIVEAVLVALDLNAASKVIFARRLPGRPNAGGDAAKSFYSGHASVAFSFATSTGTVASLRGYRSAPWVWATGLTLAAGAGYLRIAADDHWATDVLAGAAVSGAVGWAIPWLFHRLEPDRGRSTVVLVPAPGGFALVF